MIMEKVCYEFWVNTTTPFATNKSNILAIKRTERECCF